MPDTFQLEIVTPEKLVVKEAVEELQMPGANGYLGILPGHAPLITELAIGDNALHVEGLGVPPARELLAKLRDHQVPVYV